MTDLPAPLQIEHERAVAQVDDLTRELEGIIDASAGANLDDEHDPDGSTVGFERARVTALLASAARHLEDLKEAVGRVADGVYGLCVVCGIPITPERLALIPATVTCVECAGAASRGRA